MTFQESLQQSAEQLYELTLRAKKINYKNIPPRLPKNPTEATMVGFRKRFSNWRDRLKYLEVERTLGTITNDTNLLKSYLNN